MFVEAMFVLIIGCSSNEEGEVERKFEGEGRGHLLFTLSDEIRKWAKHDKRATNKAAGPYPSYDLDNWH